MYLVRIESLGMAATAPSTSVLMGRTTRSTAMGARLRVRRLRTVPRSSTAARSTRSSTGTRFSAAVPYDANARLEETPGASGRLQGNRSKLRAPCEFSGLYVELEERREPVFNRRAWNEGYA